MVVITERILKNHSNHSNHTNQCLNYDLFDLCDYYELKNKCSVILHIL